jgi:DNA-binding transcriptional regulator PaaX
MTPIKQGSFRAGLLMFLATMADIYNEVSYENVYRRLKWPGYHQVSVKHMVRKMLAENELVLDKKGLRLGIEGKRVIEGFVPVRKYRQTKWDGLWRVIIYDIPESGKSKRDQLRAMLQKYGYGLWQKSVYLTPHPVTAAITGWLKEHHMFGQVICMESKQVSGIENRELADLIFRSRERLALWQQLVKDGNRVINDGRGESTWIGRYEDYLMKEPWLPRELEMSEIEALRQKAARIMQGIIA